MKISKEHSEHPTKNKKIGFRRRCKSLFKIPKSFHLCYFYQQMLYKNVRKGNMRVISFVICITAKLHIVMQHILIIQ